MRLDQMIQFMKQVSGKVGSSIYASVQDPSNPQHIHFLKQLQKETAAAHILDTPLQELQVVVFDFETTGFFPEKGDEILSIGAIKATGQHEAQLPPFYNLVKPTQPIPDSIRQLTGIQDEEVQHAPPIEEVLIQFLQYAKNHVLVAHHSKHEEAFLKYATRKLTRKTFQQRIIDTSFLIKIVEPNTSLLHLEDYCTHCGIEVTQRHHALEDAKMTAKIWSYYLERVIHLGYKNLREVYEQLNRMR